MVKEPCASPPPPDSESNPWRVVYEITEADLRHLYAEYYKHRFAAHRDLLSPRRRFWLSVSLFAMVGSLGVLLYSFAFAWFTPPAPLVLVLIVVTLATAASLVDDRRRRAAEAGRQLQQTMRSHQVDLLIGRWQVEVLADGIRTIGAPMTGHYNWMAVSHAALDDGFVAIHLLVAHGCSIPLHAFRDRAHAQCFVDHVNTSLAAHKAGSAQRVLAYLASADHACPACRYNLRGVSALQCPECGRAIEWTDVPRAFERQSAAPSSATA